MINSKLHLSDFIDQLQAMGRYTFTLEDVLSVNKTVLINTSHQAIKRLADKQRVIRIKKHFYTIIPVEYKQSGALPVSWYINDLMNYLQLPYYIGLLSASSIYGATHQQPQEFQVITTKPFRSIRVGRSLIHFYVKKSFDFSDLRHEKVPTGTMTISSPELTVLDLIRYPYAAGYWNNVVSVIQTFQESLSVDRLLKLVDKESVGLFQRLGFLLEHHANITALTEDLNKIIEKKKPRYQLFDSNKTSPILKKDTRWRLFINTTIEEEE